MSLRFNFRTSQESTAIVLMPPIALKRARAMRLDSRASGTLDGGCSGTGLPRSAYYLLGCFGSIGELRAGTCSHRRNDPIVRAIDQIVQITGRDGPEYG
jgi:hypothetical protein